MRIYGYTYHYDEPDIRIVITPNDNTPYHEDKEAVTIYMTADSFVDLMNEVLTTEQKESLYYNNK